MVDINIGLDELKTAGLWRAVIAEFLGSAFFLLATTVVCLVSGTGAAAHIAIGIGIGLSITTGIILVGHVSGGHLNPAVSFAMVIAGKVSILRGLLYIVGQLVGAIVGSAFTYGLISASGTLGATIPASGVSEAQGFGLELLFTLILVLYVFSITDGAKTVDTGVTAIGVGVCILVAHVCLIPLTGCGINPARSFGPAVVGNQWTSHWIYWIGPLVGGLVGAILYKFVLGHCDEAAAEPAAAEEPAAEEAVAAV